jgi:hypothetical protein
LVASGAFLATLHAVMNSTTVKGRQRGFPGLKLLWGDMWGNLAETGILLKSRIVYLLRSDL